MAYVPPQAQPVKRYPGEMIVPDLINDRIAPFLRSVGALNPFTAPFVVPMTYGKGMIEAARDAQKRGSRIPGLPELGLSEAAGSFRSQLGDDLKTTFLGSEKIEEIPTTPETSKPIEVTDKLRELAFEKKAPGTTPESLKDYYSAQKAVGAAEKEGLSAAFGGDTPMGQWAKANPDLALRLLQKREAKGMATVGGKEVPLEEEATVEMSPMERIKFIQGGFR